MHTSVLTTRVGNSTIKRDHRTASFQDNASDRKESTRLERVQTRLVKIFVPFISFLLIHSTLKSNHNLYIRVLLAHLICSGLAVPFRPTRDGNLCRPLGRSVQHVLRDCLHMARVTFLFHVEHVPIKVFENNQRKKKKKKFLIELNPTEQWHSRGCCAFGQVGKTGCQAKSNCLGYLLSDHLNGWHFVRIRDGRMECDTNCSVWIEWNSSFIGSLCSSLSLVLSSFILFVSLCFSLNVTLT